MAHSSRKSTWTMRSLPIGTIFAFLEHPQQLGLQVRRHLADLVEQQRAALRHFEQAFLVQRGAGERAFLVAEQLGLDEIFWNRGAVDLDERSLQPLAVVVHRIGDELLAGAVLTLNQDVGFAGGHAFHQLEQVLHLLALADHVLKLVAILQLGFQLLVLVNERLLLDRLLEFVEQPLRVDRLFEKVERAGFHRFHGSRDVALAADDDDLGFGIELTKLADQLNPVDVREHHVGDHDIWTPGAKQLLAAGADERGFDLVARVLEQNFQPLGHRRLIVYRQHPLLAFQTHGRILKRKRAMSQCTNTSRVVFQYTDEDYLHGWANNLSQAEPAVRRRPRPLTVPRRRCHNSGACPNPTPLIHPRDLPRQRLPRRPMRSLRPNVRSRESRRR